MVNWIQGRDLVAVNLSAALNSPAEGGDLQTIHLVGGTGVTLPDHDFYLFFPGDSGTGETAEYVYIASRSADTLSCGPDPFLVSPTTGRAAINSVRWPAAHHPAAARLELRNVFEVHAQLQARLDAHTHDGTTANGPVLTQDHGTSIMQLTNNTISSVSFGDVITCTGGLAGEVPSTGYLGLPIGIIYSPQGGPPTGASDFSIIPGDPVYAKISGVGWARCDSTVTAGSPIQAKSVTKTVANLVSPALGAIGFALTNAALYVGKYYCQVLLVNRGADVLTLSGVQDVRNKTIYSPVIYAGIDTSKHIFLPTTVGDDTLVGAAATQTLTNKTLTSPTVTGAAISGGSVSGAAITATNAALTTPTITGLVTLASAVSRIKLGATSLSIRNAGDTLDFLLVDGTGRIDMPQQARVLATWSGSVGYSSMVDAHVPGNVESYDLYSEWNSSTYTFSPTTTGVYLLSAAIGIVPTTPVYFKLFLESSTGLLDNQVAGEAYTSGATTVLSLNASFPILCAAGQTYWYRYIITQIGSTPPMTGTVANGFIAITRLG